LFTPEFSNSILGEFTLLAAHDLTNDQSESMSIAFNKARIAFGLAHLPNNMKRCRLVYDVRGQQLQPDVLVRVKAAFQDLCSLEIRQ
jgi:hypothetical protein